MQPPAPPTGALLDALNAADRALSSGDLATCRVEVERAEQAAEADSPDVAYMRALLLYEEQRDEEARRSLQLALERDPTFADAHYALAAICEDQGQRKQMIAHWLRVRALDAEQDRAAALGDRVQLDRLERVAREVLDALPAEMGDGLRDIPVILEDRPSSALVETGFDPRAFGLFDGQPHGQDSAPVPTRIVLFTHNLLADFGDDRALLEEQIEITLLHEIGHFYGLDEQQVEDLGLG